MLLVSDGYYKIKLYKVQFFLERSFRGCHPSNLDNTEVDGTLGLAFNVFEMSTHQLVALVFKISQSIVYF